MSRQTWNLDQWIDGKVILDLKEKNSKISEEIDQNEKKLKELILRKKSHLLTKEEFNKKKEEIQTRQNLLKNQLVQISQNLKDSLKIKLEIIQKDYEYDQ